MKNKMEINTLSDIYTIENIALQKLFLEYNTIDNSKLIKFVNSIDMSEFNKSSDIENWIFYAIAFVKTRDEKSLNKSFEYLYKILPTEYTHITFIFSIVHMLFYIAKIYKVNLSNLMSKYQKEIIKIENPVSFSWLVDALVQNGFCEKDLINKVFDSNIFLSLKENLLDDIQNNCKESYNIYAKKLAEFIVRLAKNENGLQADYHYGLAIEIYKKIDNYSEIDKIKLLKMELDFLDDIQEVEIKIPTKELDDFIARMKNQIDINIQDNQIVKAFAMVFNTQVLPNENDMRKSLNVGVFTQLATVMPITAGRKGIVSKERENDYFFYEQYGMGLINIQGYIFYNLLNYLQSKIDLKEIVLTIYKESPIFDNNRLKLFDDIIDKFINDDFNGFVYSVVPNIEYLIKEILKLNGVSPHNRAIIKEEDISLNSLVMNNKALLVKIYGNDFIVLLEYFFTYEYGLNMRNALMHGEGIEYLSKEYSDWLLYIFIILIGYTKEIDNA